MRPDAHAHADCHLVVGEGDAALDTLVDEALQHNQDLALATARVNEARALARAVDSQRMPLIEAGFQRDRTRSSERSSMPLPPGTLLERNNYVAQLSVAYEVDLWERLASASRAARADVLATEAARAKDVRKLLSRPR